MKKEKIRKLIITKAKDTAPLNEKQFLYHTNFEGCLAFWELFVRQHREAVLNIQVPQAAVPIDFNTG